MTSTITQAFQTVWVPISKIIREPYQRDPDKRRIRKMVRDYDPALWEPIRLADRGDGFYAVIDGQHRVEVARDRDEEQIQADVRSVPEYADRARLYRRYNARTTHVPLGALDDFRAAIEEEDPRALNVQTALDWAGLTMGSEVNCPKLMLKLASQPLALVQTMRILGRSDIHNARQNHDIPAWLIRGLFEVLTSTQRDVDEERMINLVKTRWLQIEVERHARVRGNNDATVASALIRDEYNKRLGEHKRI